MEKTWNGYCKCGHSHDQHGVGHTHNYSAGRCMMGGCKCLYFVHVENKANTMKEQTEKKAIQLLDKFQWNELVPFTTKLFCALKCCDEIINEFEEAKQSCSDDAIPILNDFIGLHHDIKNFLMQINNNKT